MIKSVSALNSVTTELDHLTMTECGVSVLVACRVVFAVDVGE